MIINMISNITNYDHNYEHKHKHKYNHKGYIEPKPLIFKVRPVYNILKYSFL
jgi:hypothetical protein